MTKKQQFWIGYGELRDLFRSWAHDEPRRLYLNSFVETIPTGIGSLVIHKHTVQAARLDTENGLCHYWRMVTGKHDVVIGAPREEAAIAAEKRTAAAVEVLERVAEEHFFEPVKAVIAAPKNLVFYEGGTKFLRYDPQSELYVRVETRRANAEAA